MHMQSHCQTPHTTASGRLSAACAWLRQRLLPQPAPLLPQCQRQVGAQMDGAAAEPTEDELAAEAIRASLETAAPAGAALSLAELLGRDDGVRHKVLVSAGVGLRALCALRYVSRCWRDWVDEWAAGGALPQLCVLGGGRPPSDEELEGGTDGTVLSTITVVSCVHSYSPAALVCPGTSVGWSRLPQMHGALCAAAVCGLPDGRIFVAGGMDQELEPLSTAFIYDPTGSTPGGHLDLWCRALDTMPVPGGVSGARAALLSCGKRVLVVGGDSVLSAADSVAAAAAARENNPEASMMLPGALGGQVAQPPPPGTLNPPAAEGEEDESDDEEDGQPTTLATASIFNLETLEWTSAASMSSSRAHFAIGVLGDGRVVVAGGLCSVTEEVTSMDLTGGEETLRTHGSAPLAEAEIYDPRTDEWVPLPDLPGGPRAGCR